VKTFDMWHSVIYDVVVVVVVVVVADVALSAS
jgi:hypothetical protein